MMKKLLALILLLSISITVSGCTEEPKPIEDNTPVDDTIDCEAYPNHIDCFVPDPDDPVDPVDPIVHNFIDIFYMNDFHGAILEDYDDYEIGLSGISAYIKNHEATYPDNTLVIAGGDMLQGSALSNYYDGYSTILLMNEIGFDAFTLGNHEFDWGIDTVTNYFDGNPNNGEAEFPLLAANVYYEGTDTVLENTVPYVIYEIYDIEIAIIGTMGYGLEYSIAESKINGYEFRDPVPIIAEYSEYLRTVEDVEIVIWVGHDSGNMNTEIAALQGDQRVDALFNAHSHTTYATRTNGLPTIQAGANGEAVGYLRIYFDDNGVTDYDYRIDDLFDSAYFQMDDPVIESLVNGFIMETDPILREHLAVSADHYNRLEIAEWMCELITIKTSSAIAFHNYSGGIRAEIAKDENIDIYKLYELFPFDNTIKTVTLSGEEINHLIQYSGYAYFSNVETFIDTEYYKVATNDYIFDKESNPFIDGTDIYAHSTLLRDLIADELRLQRELYDYFDVNNQLQTQSGE